MLSRLNFIIFLYFMLTSWPAFSLTELQSEWLKCDKDTDCGAANSGCKKWVAVNKHFIITFDGVKGYSAPEGVQHSDSCLKSMVSPKPPVVTCLNKMCKIWK